MVRSDRAVAACPSCHSWLSANAKTSCPRCGAALSPPTSAYPSTPSPSTIDRGASSPPTIVSRERSTPGITSVVVVGLSAALIVLFGLLRLWWAELVLVPATILLIYGSVEVPWARLGVRAERLAARRAGHLHATVRSLYARTAERSRRVGVWLAISGRHARVWVEVRTQQVPVRHRHNQMLHALGHAVYSGDEERAVAHRMSAATTGARLEHLERRLALVRHEAARRVRRERAGTDVNRVIPAASDGRRAQADEHR